MRALEKALKHSVIKNRHSHRRLFRWHASNGAPLQSKVRSEKAVILAATEKTSSYSRAFNEIARQAIHLAGEEGLSIARQLGF